ncbi:MAG: choice-of-anchor B family protein [Fimbriimonadaceae bacterium]|nr:choice-of-anchor B family protein [Chitinophagales bacterium]
MIKRILFIGFVFISNYMLAQSHITYAGQVQYDVRSASLTRYVDDLGNEYALIGTYNATSIVDITDPTAPVELFYVPGPLGIWREMKTYNHHAYITNETDSGLQIIDLTNLPLSVESSYLKFAGGDSLNSAHTIYIDENGLAYLFGANTDSGGATILDLNIDPVNPPKVGSYDGNYIHDGFVRGDTLWAGFIYTGKVGVVDVSDKTSPVLLAEQLTPFAFTHNCWLSDDGNFLFTTDERPGAFVAAYDVSDITDIKEVGRFQSHPGTEVIPHNVYWLNNYLVIAYYRDGVIIVDATKPDNMIQVGNYDTSPFEPAGLFNGCWGVDPYLPSGNIIASDIEEGLFILQPDYHRASYLEGTITDELNPDVPVNAKVEIMGTSDFDLVDFTGSYKTGTSEAGIYDVRISKAGCYTKIIPGVELFESATNILNESIACTLLVDNTDMQQQIYLEAFPNVFQNTTTIKYILPSTMNYAQLNIFDIAGNKMNTYSISNSAGEIYFGDELNNGMYLIQLIAEDKSVKVFKVVKG